MILRLQDVNFGIGTPKSLKFNHAINLFDFISKKLTRHDECFEFCHRWDRDYKKCLDILSECCSCAQSNSWLYQCRCSRNANIVEQQHFLQIIKLANKFEVKKKNFLSKIKKNVSYENFASALKIIGLLNET